MLGCIALSAKIIGDKETSAIMTIRIGTLE